MSFSSVAIASIAAYIAASVLYVYRWRGNARYAGFGQYLRKSWPVFAPFNCVLYLATRRSARRPVLDAGYLQGISIVRERWRLIRDEALALYAAGGFDATCAPGSVGYYDVGFRTFYKRGWKKFYLSWYGAPHRSALRLCPQTVRALEQVPGIRAAMFSVLPAGAALSLHSDPMACSLRYHLGLATPNRDECFIDIDGRRVSWRDGEDFVFDETYPHYAINGSGAPRIILMCDVQRPMNLLGRGFNRLYSSIPRAMTVPNTDEDRRGPISALFSIIAPWRTAALAFKQRRRPVYRVLKFSFNAAALLLAMAAVYTVLKSIEHAGRAVLQ